MRAFINSSTQSTQSGPAVAAGRSLENAGARRLFHAAPVRPAELNQEEVFRFAG
jgi:hypothetical protein